MDSFPLLVAIVGPTAVGKTALSLDLAESCDAEIVSVDSRLIYRGMNIGTAKPTPAELARVPHHMIDLVNPDADFSLAMFQTLAYEAINGIIERGRLPLLAGGTGQYAAALLEGWQIPQVPPQPDLRSQLEADAVQFGVQAMFERVREVDPDAAAAIGPSNLRRLIRALEVWMITGTPISVLQQRQPPPYRIKTLFLDRERADLYQRIDERVDAMVQAGLIDEVFGLVSHGYGWDLPSMSSLGYAEFAPLWRGEASAETCIQQLKFNTHRFARKQYAWFRRLPHLTILDATSPTLFDDARRLVVQNSAVGP